MYTVILYGGTVLSNDQDGRTAFGWLNHPKLDEAPGWVLYPWHLIKEVRYVDLSRGA